MKDYYGCHPHLLEGIEVFMNSENQKCFDRSKYVDMTKQTPVTTN